MLPTIVLREYQKEIRRGLANAYKNGKKCVVVVSSTGSGKTKTFCSIPAGASPKGHATCLCAHRKEIIKQMSLSLGEQGVYHWVVASKKVMAQIKLAHMKAFQWSYIKKDSNVLLGSVQTLINRLDNIRIIRERAKSESPGSMFFLIMDEGHHVVQGSQHGTILEYCQRLGANVSLWTATPERLDGKGLGIGWGGYADEMIEAPQTKWFIENDFLSPYKIFTTPKRPDLPKGDSSHDYKQADLEQAMDSPRIVGDAIEHYKREAMGMKAVAFCVSVEASKKLAQAFCDAGITAAHIDGTTDDEIREKAIMDFADGKVMVLCQVDILSEGFDLSSIANKPVTIECLIDLAPTKSLAKAMQRWGRILRFENGKIAVILDHACNAGPDSHGTPTTHRFWTLEGRRKGEKSGNENKKCSRTCPKCFSTHDAAPKCPNPNYLGTGKPCGYVYPVMSREIEEVDGTLKMLEEKEAAEVERVNKRKDQGRAKTLDELIVMAVARGNSPAWAFNVFMSRQGSTIQLARGGINVFMSDIEARLADASDEDKEKLISEAKKVWSAIAFKFREKCEYIGDKPKFISK